MLQGLGGLGHSRYSIKELLPMSDSLAIFLVEPGVSFHAVREVRGDRARVSLQGPTEPKQLYQRPFCTLKQLSLKPYIPWLSPPKFKKP